jgi:hypothetical protein
MSLVEQFKALVNTNGSPVVYHRDESLVPCPCRTPEGQRDPVWHFLHLEEPVCNEAGFLPQPGTTSEFTVKAFVQPIQSTRATRLSTEFIQQMFGEVEADDHLGIFPIDWQGQFLNFYDWGESQEDWITYDGRRFTVVNANKIPDPSDGNPNHHWEVGLRLINSATLAL